MIRLLATHPFFHSLWRIGWLERWFFHACRWLRLRDDDLHALFDNTVFGFDFSKWQGAIDFQKVKNYGAKFVILRAAYGRTKDERFDEYMPSVQLPVSVYHYYDPRYNPLEQAFALIDALAPYKDKVRRVWLDLEFPWDGAYKAPSHWKAYRDEIKRAGYRVGWYTRKTWWDSRVGGYAAEFAKDPVWAAQYSSALTLIPAGWSIAMLWQSGVPAIGAAVGAGSLEVDYNQWNTDFDFFLEWDGVPYVPVPFGYSQRRVYDSDVHFVKLPSFSRVHVTDTGGKLVTTSEAARQHNADYAINGDGWYLGPDGRQMPLSLAASDGEKYQPRQFDYQPYFHVGRNNVPMVQWQDFPDMYNCVSGTRLSVWQGRNYFHGSTDPEHISERHPRSAVGYTQEGKLILCVVDGRSATSQGATLWELAEILLLAGAHNAIELDDGGSSTLWAEGGVKNAPSDGTERAVINHLLVWTGEAVMATAKSTTHELSLRPLHQVVNSSTILKVPVNTVLQVLDGWQAPETTDYNLMGDRWVQVTYGGKTGWVGLVHLGNEYGTTDYVFSAPQPSGHVVEVFVDGASVYRVELT